MSCVAGVSVSPLASSHAQAGSQKQDCSQECELAGDPARLVTKA